MSEKYLFCWHKIFFYILLDVYRDFAAVNITFATLKINNLVWIYSFSTYYCIWLLAARIKVNMKSFFFFSFPIRWYSVLSSRLVDLQQYWHCTGHLCIVLNLGCWPANLAPSSPVIILCISRGDSESLAVFVLGNKPPIVHPFCG